MKKRKELSAQDYVTGVLAGDRVVLARAITLLESESRDHHALAHEVLKQIRPYADNSIRICITGTPGVGKSTFLETLGSQLCQQGYKIAVLAIDPSSTITQGSILGDKTRMQKLSNEENCFIRPSSSRGELGGVHCKTREVIQLCEAAGYNVIFIETVGVGQSESAARNLCDFLLLLVPPLLGDYLQTIKRGVVELIDGVFINRAENENAERAKQMEEEFKQILQHRFAVTQGWTPEVYRGSALTGSGIDHLWASIERFKCITQKSGFFKLRRKNQLIDWLHELIVRKIRLDFFEHPHVKELLPKMKKNILHNNVSVEEAVQDLLNAYRMEKRNAYKD